MKIKSLVALFAVSAALVACGGGDINIDAQTNDNSNDNSTNNSNNVNVGGGSQEESTCASYTIDDSVTEGFYNGTDCVYSSSFVDIDAPLLADATFKALPGSGVHLFDGSLVVGQSYSSTADMNSAGITEGGDGPSITIEAGAVLAFGAGDFININRGSQINAIGSKTRPIILTGKDDVNGTLSSPEDDQAWGGVIINGFAVNNNCAYTGNRGESGFAMSAECSNLFEGTEGITPVHSGGDNDADNSGRMEYVVVKHAGSEVADGKEINGVTFNSVGNATVVNNLEVYSSYDDGIEFFGGAVDITNYVAVYVRDDSIDVDEGYIGTVDTALVIQSETNGNHCVESDGLGGYGTPGDADRIAQGLNSAATIINLTCIVSPQAEGTHGEGAGLRIREAHFATIQNAIVTTAYLADGKTEDDASDDTDGNYCLRLESAEGLQAAVDGELMIEESIFACHDLSKGDDLPDGNTQVQFLQASNDVMQTAVTGQDPTAGSEPNIVILDGFYSVPLVDMVVDGNVSTVTPVDGRAYIGAVLAAEDWTTDWTYGLHIGSRGQALWFE
ncbi:hypothetical protein SAMN02745866_03025 [Alteromonadaceae bacterium Bs31]|nr:hypothetical protein SAMN02745866_03025 [Alteromonadaceae bacterium Bs31]